MESTAFFEKKISLTPRDFNEVKHTDIEQILSKKASLLMESKCSEQGFVIPGSIKLLSRSMGYFETARFTGDAVYYVKLEGKIIYPADGVRIIGEVTRKNKMGLYVNYRDAVRIQVPRDLHLGSEEYEEVEIGDIVEIELKRSKFQINDQYILASGLFIEKKSSDTPIVAIQPTSESKEKDGEEEVDIEDAEGDEDDAEGSNDEGRENDTEGDEDDTEGDEVEEADIE